MVLHITKGFYVITITHIPQRYSPDYYLRLRLLDLNSLMLEHTFTHVTNHSPLAGFTEWCAATKGVILSVSWEWVRNKYDCLQTPPKVSILTNLMLITDAGYDAGTADTEKALLRLLERLAWREVVSRSFPQGQSSMH